MDVVFIGFVDGVVGQVHEGFLEVGLGRGLVSSRAEASQSFIVDEGLNWVEPGNDNVNTQVELDAIEEQRGVQVPLHDDITAIRHVLQVSQILKERDLVALATDIRLSNKCCIFVLLLVCFETGHLLLF